MGFLVEAVGHWAKYGEISERHYKTQMLARTKMIDWKAILSDVKQDIELAKRF